MKLAIIFVIILIILLFTASAKGLDTITLTETNHMSLNSEVDSELVAKTILKIEKSTSPVTYLFIDSPGGFVLDGIILINYLQTSTRKIECIAKRAQSVAHAILQSCPVRLGTESNILMQHRITTPLEGTGLQIKDEIRTILGMQYFLDFIESSRIGLSVEEFSKKSTTNWSSFGVNSILENRLDKIVKVACDSALYAKETKKTVSTLFGSSTITINGCPLVPITVEKESR